MNETALDKKDFEMMAASIPTVDWWDIRDELDRLSENVNRLETILKAILELYNRERVKTWELVITRILEREDKKAKERKANK